MITTASRLWLMAIALVMSLSSGLARAKEVDAEAAEDVPVLERLDSATYAYLQANWFAATGRIWGGARHTMIRSDGRVVRHSLYSREPRQGESGERDFASPEAVAREAWWRDFQGRHLTHVDAELIEYFDGSRHTSFRRVDLRNRGSTSGWSGTRHKDPKHFLMSPVFLKGSYFVGHRSCASRLRSDIVKEVPGAMWSAVRVVVPPEYPDSPAIVRLKNSRGLVATEVLLIGATSIEGVLSHLSGCSNLEAVRSWSSVRWHHWVKAWQVSLGGVPVPRIVWHRACNQRLDQAGGRSADMDTAYLLESVTVTVPRKWGPLPEELDGQTVDVFDELLQVHTRYHPEGRVETIPHRREEPPAHSSRKPKPLSPGEETSEGRAWRLFRWGVIGALLALLCERVWRWRGRWRMKRIAGRGRAHEAGENPLSART